MTITNAERIAEIAARAKAATPGPWHCGSSHCLADIPGGDKGIHLALNSLKRYDAPMFAAIRHAIANISIALLPKGTGWSGLTKRQKANAAFIAAAREDIPWLLAQLRKATDWERLARTVKRAITIPPGRTALESTTVDAIAAALKAAVEKEA